ncbi:MAG: tetratricopeptide repeat protein, partial [Bacteroidota bacterium]
QFEVTNLSEEQAGVYRIHDLWEYVIRDLQSKDYDIDNPDWQEFEDDLKDYTKQLYHNIHNCLQQIGKRLILLVDNIDRIFKNIGKDNALFRELLMNFNDVRIIGGSTIMSSQYWKYDQPFYQYFKIQRLEPLTTQEIQQLLDHWSAEKQLPDIKNFLHKYPGKIQSIRMLTDGTPRTMLIFVDMLVNRPAQKGFDYLRHIIDKATPIYQERLAILSPQQQKILLELSFFWEAAPIEALVAKCKMKSKTISAQLNTLVKEHVVVKIKGKTKNYLYRLEERFFNLWLLMTQGGPREKRNVKYLTVFLENWYDQTEFKAVYTKFIDHLSSNSIRPDYAASMTKALAHSKYLTVDERDTILFKARELEGMDPRWIAHLPETSKKIYEEAWKLYEKGKYQESIAFLNKLEQEDGLKDHRMAMCYVDLELPVEGEKYYKRAIKKGINAALNNLANLYKSQGRLDESENYYRAAIEKGDVGVLNNLAILYSDQGRLEESEKYFKEAIKIEDVEALNNLAVLYSDQGRFEESERYYKEAIGKGCVEALYNLANLYKNQGRFKESERYYKEAIEKGEIFAMYNLALLYSDQGRFEESEKYYRAAVEKGDVEALNNLANLYSGQGRLSESERYYEEAIEKGHVGAIYNLANLYSDQGRLEESEKYYKKAIEKGDIEALNNLANLYSDQGRFKESERYYREAIGKGHLEAIYNLANLYLDQGLFEESEKYYKKAIEKNDVEALNNLANLYLDQGRLEESEKYYKEAIENGYVGALNNLAVLYSDRGLLEESEKYFKEAIEKGDVGALNNLAVLYSNQGRLEESKKYYRQAIEKGDVEALNNLAVLYSNQGRLEESEKHYQEAIGKGHVGALNNLALLYYNKNIKVQDANDLIDHYLTKKPDDQVALAVQAILNLWAGNLAVFHKQQETLLQKITADNIENLNWYIGNLLIHKQYHLTLQVFEESDKRLAMKEKLKPVWYAALQLADTQDKRLLQMPPEIAENMNDILQEIHERQEVYYGSK